jgi:tol-pal system protein YbgF
MARSRQAVLALFVLVALGGCAGVLPGRSPAPAADPLSELRAELQEVRRSQEAQSRTLGALTADLSALHNTVARLSAEARQRDGSLASLQSNLSDLVVQVKSLSPAGPVIPPAPGRPGTESAPPAATSSPEELYESALSRYRAGQLDAAMIQLYDFVVSYPDHRLRDSAQLLLGDIYYRQKDYEGALTEYQALIGDLPKSDKVPDALLKSGLCYRALGDMARARSAWERVVREFPKSAAAKQAQSLLGKRKG